MRRGDASRSRTRLAVPLAVALVTGLLIATAQTASTAPRSLGKVDAKVVSQMRAQGSASFWVLLRQKADLSAAPSIKKWGARGEFVVRQLKSVANSSQRSLRAYLDARHVSYQSFWIINGIRVVGATAPVLSSVVARTDVKRIVATWSVPVERGIPSAAPEATAAVEWGLKNIGAPKVWKQFLNRGQGTVVANIDTGVQFTHPALVKQYRGNNGGGSFTHNYNWWDPAHICSGTGATPCDNNSHGTHTMGTMVGRDGVNKIGVAPKAKWIAAKGCESSSCSDASLLSSGQFILAPTRTDGTMPDASKRPDVVNNSWGTPLGSDTFYQATVNAWVASGIFPQFSNGNSGPSCGTVGAPGSYINSYGAGAYDINNNIASFSSRGPSPFSAEIKPNIAAPGVAVRSSVPTNSYAVFNGTSMASPHVAGTVALLISENSALRGNINGLRSILDNTATDTSVLTCGGTADDNNVFGEGRLNAFAAVGAAKTAREG
jgi:subtilisin family serine protease